MTRHTSASSMSANTHTSNTANIINAVLTADASNTSGTAHTQLTATVSFTLAVQTQQGVQISQHQVPHNTPVLQALQTVGVKASMLRVGVWGRMVKPQQTVRQNDRVECYLPLIADPKDARRARVNRTIAQQAAKENAANRAARALRKLQQATAKPD